MKVLDFGLAKAFAGGGVIVLCSAVFPWSRAWSSEGWIIFAAQREGIVLQSAVERTRYAGVLNPTVFLKT